MLDRLKAELKKTKVSGVNIRNFLLYQGYKDHFDDPVPLARARATQALFTGHVKHVYDNDLIAGSLLGLLSPAVSQADLDFASRVTASYGFNTFRTNADHYAPDYAGFLADGIPGTLARIKAARQLHSADEEKQDFLAAVEISVRAFSDLVRSYGQAAEEKAVQAAGEQKENLSAIAQSCQWLCEEKPASFQQALQLVFLAHLAFVYEGRYAMALGRLDQYLWPFYEKDLAEGRLDAGRAQALLECTLIKLGEHTWLGGDDVVNIAIGGKKRDGGNAENELSFLILEAVGNCRIPGPNLSARIHENTSDEFLDRCLAVIGTGLGYPALMNDEVNIPALARYGYSVEDCRDYSMVGCIENFITGKQPPWSDGRYNAPKYLELALNEGRCLLTGRQMGPQTPPAASLATMADFKAALKEQMVYGAAEYMMFFRNDNDRFNKIQYSQPFLSVFCQDCIGRGLDINNGGSIYPSVHGAGCMGIATFADSLAAVEEVVFNQGYTDLPGLLKALAADFAGYDLLRARLLQAPKYGNNIDLVDKYAVWYVELMSELFAPYKTRDGGGVYVAIASNVNNIPAGREIAATPDGRRSGQPLSDAASPMRGADRKGPTSAILSVAKPDYTLAACGTVLNQKFTSQMLQDPAKRARVQALVRTYFARGGQEIQINSVSREDLLAAMEKPDEYLDLVVRVSGFSAYFVKLDKAVQLDILSRTEHA